MPGTLCISASQRGDVRCWTISTKVERFSTSQMDQENRPKYSWFNNEEVARIQELNLNYMEQKDMAEIVEACFRKPQEGEGSKSLNSSQLIKFIQQEYPAVQNTHSAKVHLGLAMKELGFEHVFHGNARYYKVILQRAV